MMLATVAVRYLAPSGLYIHWVGNPGLRRLASKKRSPAASTLGWYIPPLWGLYSSPFESLRSICISSNGLYERAALNAEIDVEDRRVGRECGAAVFEEGETYEVVAGDDEFGLALAGDLYDATMAMQ